MRKGHRSAGRPSAAVRRMFCAAGVIATVGAAGCHRPGSAGAGGKLQIALIPKGVTQSYWQTVKAGAEKAAAEDNASIIFQGPTEETQTVEQKNILDAQIVKGVSGIVMAACDAHALAPEVQKAQAAGIPVVMIDSGITPDTSVAFIATNNVTGGADAADELARLVGPKGGDVGLLPFVKGAGSSDDRENGFKQELAKYPQLHLVVTLYSNSDVNKGQDAVDSMLAAHPGLAGIFACNQGGAVGAAQSIRQKGDTGKVKLVAFDGGDEEIADLKDGVIQALVVQRPFQMGYQGVKRVVQAIKAHEVKSNHPEQVDTGVTVVTMQNFNQPDIQKLLYPLGPGK
ncbi:MAG: ABC transporter substrate-binding protein [Armatimonadetes bacterium]|nr:ABC transporter substrate-binding protein [Armatimonadota bacterium]MDE2208060.1 ABC transporter substrate-binding protein [Armatimonadota bacterium]